MGIFDDLIPQEKVGGIFDDLIPARDVSEAPTPARLPREVESPSFDMGRGLGARTGGPARTSSFMGGVGDDDISSARDEARRLAEIEREEMANAEPDPLAGEGIGSLATRRGQQFARGATEVIAAVPETAAIAGAGNPNASAQFASEVVEQAREQMRAADERLRDNPNMSAQDRERVMAVKGEAQTQIDAYQPMIDIADGPLKPDAQDRPLFKAGQSVRDASAATFGTPDPRDSSFWGQVAEGGGNMTALAATAFLGPLGLTAGAGLGASMNSASLYTEARDAGASEEDAKLAASWGAAIGATEIIPINRALKLLPPRLRNKVGGVLYKRVNNIAQGAGEEAAQEYLATVANNIVAQNIYDPDRGWTEGATEAALVGAVLGGAIGGVGSARTRDDDPDRVNSQRLTEADRASPLPNAILDDGKAAVDSILSGEPQTRATLQGIAPLDETGANVKTPDTEFMRPRGVASPLPPVAPTQDAAPANLSEAIPEVDENGQDTGRMVRIDMETGGIVEDAPQQATEQPAPTVPAFPIDTVQTEGLPESIERPVAPVPAKPARPSRPTVQKRPLTHRMKEVGVKPGSPLAKELNARDITARTHPGLFKASGATDWDNLPVQEYQDLAASIPDDGNGYLSQDGIIDALANETRGELLPVGEQAELRAVRDAKEAQARLDESGVEPAEIDLADFEGASYVIPQRDQDISTDGERYENIQRSVDATLDAINAPEILEQADYIEIYDSLSDSGGNVEDAIWAQVDRSVERAERTEQSERIARRGAVDSGRTEGEGASGQPESGGGSPQPAIDTGPAEASQQGDEAGERTGEREAEVTPRDEFAQAKAEFDTLNAVEEIADADAYFKASGRLTRARKGLADTLAKEGGRIELKNSMGNGATITPTGKGFQISYFDKRGFSGDTRHDTLEAATRGAVNQGYDVEAKGLLKTAQKGSEWISPAETERQMQEFDKAIKSPAKPTSWVLRNKETGQAVLETRDQAKVDALNTDKYEAVPATQHLKELNQPNSKARKAAEANGGSRLPPKTLAPENSDIDGTQAEDRSLGGTDTIEKSALGDRGFKNNGTRWAQTFDGGLLVNIKKTNGEWSLTSTDRRSGAGSVPSQNIGSGKNLFSLLGKLDEFLAGKIKATTERTEAGTQTVIPGAEQSEERSTEARKGDQQREVEVRAQQSKMRTSTPQADAGGLFDTQGDIFDAPRAEVAPEPEVEETATKADPIKDVGDKIGGARKDTAESTGARKTKAAKDERPAWLRRYEIGEVVADAFDKSKVGKFTITDLRTGKQIRERFKAKAFDTREEAEAAIPLYEVARNHRVTSVGDGTFKIIRAVSDRKRPTIKDGFESRDAAELYMAQNAVEIIETKTRIDDSIHPALEEAIREGEARREDGRNVAADDFREVFGFRGVEFGNWNNNAERQHILNQAYDAFMDLSEITQIPPKAISLNGELALGFGSRGHGLSGASAHYERNYGAINLTKIKGAGALAHEWMHAVDHYFARIDGKASPRDPNAGEGQPIYDAKSPEVDYSSSGFLYKSKMRDDVKAAIKSLMQTIAKRKVEFTEDQSTREKVSERLVTNLDKKLDAFIADISREQSYGRKKDPATGAQILKAQKAIAAIKADNLGEMKEAPSKAKFAVFMFNEPVLTLAEIYKEVRGRQAYGMQQGRMNGWAVDIQNAIETKNQAQKFLNDAKTEKVKEKTVATEFVSEAWRLDQGGKKDYWSSNHELMARAFEGFIYDRLKDVDARNDFLAYEKHNDIPEYKMFGVKPYPEGQERKDINAAFANLFDVLETETGDEGNIRMYRVADGSGMVDRRQLRRLMPDLRTRLNKMGLARVSLERGTTASFQGVFEATRTGEMRILIGQTLNAEQTIDHEAIHALRAMNLFSDKEWAALEAQANQEWLKKYDIADRYSDLSPEAQIEEAIAEAFADRAPKPDGLITNAFAKLRRFFKAMREALTGQEITSIDQVFSDVEEGVIGSRNQEAVKESGAEQRRPLSRFGREETARQSQSAHIPDRNLWEEAADRNVNLLRRPKGVKGAIEDRIDRFRTTLQDRMLILRRAEEAIEKNVGIELTKAESAYYAEERYSGRVGSQLDALTEEYTLPIARMIARDGDDISLTDQNGDERTDSDAVGLWLTARHAKERNKYIGSINDKMNDGGSGMTNAQADAILAEAAGQSFKQKLDAIGAMMDTLGAKMIDLRESAGLLTDDEAKAWRAQYKHYVPLKGFAETDMYDEISNEATVRRGRNFTVQGKESARAMGRTTEAFDPLATMLAQAEEVIVRAEKNIVAKTLHDLIKKHPNPAIWEVKDLETRRVFNKAAGRVETQIMDPASVRLAPNEMALKVEGIEKRIVFNDPRLGEAMGQVGTNELGTFSRMASYFSRYFSAVNTMLSPPFVIVNGFRDMMTAQVNLAQLPKGIRSKIQRKTNFLSPEYWKAMAGAYQGQGEGGGKSQYAQYYREYAEAGAKVSFWKIDMPDAQNDRLSKLVRLEKGNALQRGVKKSLTISDNPALGWIERVNLSVDNAVRLAAFVEARNQGMTKEDAASLSKNLTVNFNRRGTAGAAMNAWFPFANAAVQGSHVLLKAAKAAPVQKLMLGAFMIGLSNELLNGAVSEEDEDGELVHDKIPDYVSARNLVISTGGDARVTIPLPYGYNVPFYAGQQLGKILRGVKDVDQVMGDIAKTTFGAFSPISGESITQTLLPTLGDHMFELATNTDWQGRPIRPESSFGDYGPQSHQEWNVPAPFSLAARGLNAATGGSDVESGYIDISPEYMHHTFKFLGGGALRFADRAGTMASAAINGDEIEAHSIPLLRVLRYEPSDWLDQGRYFEFRESVNEAEAMVKRARENKTGVPTEMADAAKLATRLKIAEKQRRNLSTKIGNIYANPDYSDRQKREQVKPLVEKRNKAYIQFNKAYIDKMGPQSE